jgi:hypothetical protein
VWIINKINISIISREINLIDNFLKPFNV